VGPKRRETSGTQKKESQEAMKRYRIERDGQWVYNRLWWDGVSANAEFESGSGFVVVAELASRGLVMVEGWD